MPFMIDYDQQHYAPGRPPRRVEFIHFRAPEYSDADRQHIAKLACGEVYVAEHQTVRRVGSDTMLAVQLRHHFGADGLARVMRGRWPGSIDAARDPDQKRASLEDLIDTVEANAGMAAYFSELLGV